MKLVFGRPYIQATSTFFGTVYAYKKCMAMTQSERAKMEHILKQSNITSESNNLCKDGLYKDSEGKLKGFLHKDYIKEQNIIRNNVSYTEESSVYTLNFESTSFRQIKSFSKLMLNFSIDIQIERLKEKRIFLNR